MKKRKLGDSGLEVVPFAFGGNVFGWTADEQESFRLLDRYVDLGFDFIDTADMYSVWVPGNKGGESETILGNWMHKRNNRDKIIISTKVGAEINSSKKGLKKTYILSAVEESLKRLRTDYIDLYFTHFDDTTVPVEEPLEAYQQLMKEGKVRSIGVSNMSASRIEESMQVSKKNNLPFYTVLQPEYNLYDRQQYEQEYESLVKKYKLGVMSYFSLASGFLTGKYRSENDFNKSQRGGQMGKYLNDRGIRILKTLDEIAKDRQGTISQVALAWLLHHPTITLPIASASKLEQLDILQAVNLDLNSDQIKKLDEASKYS